MPTYDYECQRCSKTFEFFHSISQDPFTVCPECKKDTLIRLISRGAGIVFKGSGFFVTDNKAPSSSSSDVTADSSSGSSAGAEASANAGGTNKEGNASAKKDSSVNTNGGAKSQEHSQKNPIKKANEHSSGTKEQRTQSV